MMPARSSNTIKLFITNVMNQSNNTRINSAFALIRIVVGIFFAMHGGQKLFQYGLAGVTGGFAGMGIPLAAVTAPIVTFVELVGGLALAAGAFTRIAAALLAIDMLGAIVLVHLANGFFLPTGFEYAFVLMVLSIGYVIAGAEAYSIDAIRAKKRTSGYRAVIA
jgi:putative oxidoreductase